MVSKVHTGMVDVDHLDTRPRHHRLQPHGPRCPQNRALSWPPGDVHRPAGDLGAGADVDQAASPPAIVFTHVLGGQLSQPLETINILLYQTPAKISV